MQEWGCGLAEFVEAVYERGSSSCEQAPWLRLAGALAVCRGKEGKGAEVVPVDSGGVFWGTVLQSCVPFLMSSVTGCGGLMGFAYLSTVQYSFLCSFTMEKTRQNPSQGQTRHRIWARFGFLSCDYVT